MGKCDRRLHRLMCYVFTSADDNMIGWMGDHPSLLTIHCFCDADFAGCPYTLRSTSGHHFDLQGPNSKLALCAGSNMQTSTAQSTPEAELASLQEGMKKRGEAAFEVWEKILRQHHPEAAEPNADMNKATAAPQGVAVAK